MDPSRREFLAQGARVVGRGLMGLSVIELASCGHLSDPSSDTALPPYEGRLFANGNPQLINASTGDTLIGGLPLSLDGIGCCVAFRSDVDPVDNSPIIQFDAQPLWTSLTDLGWGFRIPGGYIEVPMRIDDHELRPCVYQSVKHIHVTIMPYKGAPKNEWLSHFHVGTYRQGNSRCFVIFDNYNFNTCYRTCLPTRDQLQQIFQSALAASLASRNIHLKAWAIAGMASVLSYSLFATLLAL